MTTPIPPIGKRLMHFAVALSATLLLIFGGLPLLTESVGTLRGMSATLAEHDIDPTRYYYTDVVQVAESEQYLAVAISTP